MDDDCKFFLRVLEHKPMGLFLCNLYINGVCDIVSEVFFFKIKLILYFNFIFLIFLNYFLCVYIKNKFLKIKKILF